MGTINRKRLGKGLGALISTYENLISEVAIEDLIINEEQPRKVFNLNKLDSLIKSIKSNGILQPILVRKLGSKYQIVAGERRYRAAKEVGLERIPVIIKEIEEKEALELAIIENIERENLNPIEEIESFKLLMDKYNYNYTQLGEKFNQDRSTIVNKIRILNLPENIKQALADGKISLGHGRALLAAGNKINHLFKLVIDKNISVRELEKLINNSKNANEKLKNNSNENFKIYEEKFKNFFNFDKDVKVCLSRNKVKVEIIFDNLKEVDMILKKVKK